MTSTPLRVLVLAGGLSHERDVSLRSGRRVAEELRSLEVEVRLTDADAGLLHLIRNWNPDVVFPVLHGAAGEDGAVRAVLELAGIPYVGAEPDACRLAFDKATAKTAVGVAGISVPPGIALAHTTVRDLGAARVLDALLERFGLPLIVKPCAGGSSLGVTRVDTPEALPGAMVAAYSYGETALVERFVVGAEIAVSVLDFGAGPEALPAVEILADDGVYNYAARYTAGMTEFFVPARLDPVAAEAVARTALQAHQALGLRDVSRTDLILDAAGQPWFLEVNVAPGMTETSLLPQAVLADGRSLGDTYRHLAVTAASRSSARKPVADPIADAARTQHA